MFCLSKMDLVSKAFLLGSLPLPYSLTYGDECQCLGENISVILKPTSILQNHCGSIFMAPRLEADQGMAVLMWFPHSPALAVSHHANGISLHPNSCFPSALPSPVLGIPLDSKILLCCPLVPSHSMQNPPKSTSSSQALSSLPRPSKHSCSWPEPT